MVKKLTISKVPQCRHKDEFVSYDQTADGWRASCSNCSQASDARWPDKERARYDLMRQIGDPAVVYQVAP